MKTANELMAHNGVPENWLPMLELSAREVFEIMLGCKLESADAQQPVKTECTAMVGLAGQLCGVVTLRCSAQAASLMTSRMLGVDPKDATTEMWDAIGEVANMIAGNFKNKLTGMADGCLLSVPTVIIGDDYSTHSLADGGSVELTMLFEGEPIGLALEIHS